MNKNNDSKIKIATHDGKFHADDCFSVSAILCYLKKELSDVEVTRSRDKKDWDRADFLVDVGNVYDEVNNRFDHHQEGGAGARTNGIPYASFGLVWKKYGPEICGGLKEVADSVDETLVATVDAFDNGMDLVKPVIGDVFPYVFDRFALASNPSWIEKKESAEDNFREVVGIFKRVVEREVVFSTAKYRAREEIMESYRSAEDKRLIVLNKDYPWQAILSSLKEPLYAVYPRDDGTFGIKAVLDSVLDFKNRKNLPADWAGKRDRELQEASGVSDAVFCHNSRFMAVAKTQEGAVELAKRALNRR
ncbi:MAG: hypothetical protein A3G52_03280 [Candidatus Taylorbacteria bacterium RIFCSPLOWO2_12_FULL_43_20]|uniref:Metal-dependent hydrolase n=1 Tax=Candidatus Taylorbacteria bacterium RIFCSPLOWO2_12_FULL_43_20 TaxID=1802332 RepID=A0A1G2P389_9BACT|nr:MAG: hypothetical protein A3E92_00820 [Candidatus Taylorbacteria bacterium RIFCSPHIGHO2_12_FULL_42_34]OHA42800.1 MAG: hypothetical protein A3G52_03280 [Candidatus Taylorbacteria bacterium RIFCSPLOWO2_12_FULL_43_20]